MMRKATIAAAVILAGGMAMAGEGYTELVNSASGSKTAVPVAKASAKSIAGDKAFTVSTGEFIRMAGLKDLSENKVKALRKTQKMISDMLAQDKNSVDLGDKYYETFRLITAYETLSSMSAKSGGRIKIPSKSDATSEVVKKTMERMALTERMQALLKQGIYHSPEISKITEKAEELNQRLWFLDTILENW